MDLSEFVIGEVDEWDLVALKKDGRYPSHEFDDEYYEDLDAADYIPYIVRLKVNVLGSDVYRLVNNLDEKYESEWIALSKGYLIHLVWCSGVFMIDVLSLYTGFGAIFEYEMRGRYLKNHTPCGPAARKTGLEEDLTEEKYDCTSGATRISHKMFNKIVDFVKKDRCVPKINAVNNNGACETIDLNDLTIEPFARSKLDQNTITARYTGKLIRTRKCGRSYKIEYSNAELVVGPHISNYYECWGYTRHAHYLFGVSYHRRNWAYDGIHKEPDGFNRGIIIINVLDRRDPITLRTYMLDSIKYDLKYTNVIEPFLEAGDFSISDDKLRVKAEFFEFERSWPENADPIAIKPEFKLVSEKDGRDFVDEMLEASEIFDQTF